MFGKKLIAALVGLIVGFCASLALAQHIQFPTAGISLPEDSAFSNLNSLSIVLAQNDNTAAEDDEKSKTESEPTESESAAGEKKSSDEASKPLAPFVPSEKIPGDQAVDFPVDI